MKVLPGGIGARKTRPLRSGLILIPVELLSLVADM